MSMVRSVVQRPITMVIGCVTIMIMACCVVPLIKQSLTPDIEFPYITVSTEYKGASPLEVESAITKILEPSLVNVQGLKNISSTSSEGVSNIFLEFDWGVDLNTATGDIRDLIDRVRNYLPDDADSPRILKINMNSMIPVCGWSFSGNNMDTDELYQVADRDIKPYLTQVLGVSQVALGGGRKQQVRVELIQDRLEAYKISLGLVKQALYAANYQLGGGNIEEGSRKLSLRIDGKFTSVEQIQDTVIHTVVIPEKRQPVPIRLRDIANVYIGYADATVNAYVNGKPSLIVQIFKQSDANTVKVSEGVDEQMDVLLKQLPKGLKMEKLFDTADDVRNALHQVFESIYTGAFLTIMTLLIFLRSVKSAVIVAITMPLSIMTTIMLMYFFGLSLNVLSLAGLNLGVAMIVDSSVVLLENITRYREKGVMARSSAILGSEEMMGSIMGGSLTTICVFLPLVLFSKELGMIGALFNDMSFTIVVSLATSLVFAIITVPVLAGVFLPIQTSKQRTPKGIWKVFDDKMAYGLDWLDTKYAIAIRWSLSHRKLVGTVVFVSLGISLVILVKAVGFEFAPPSDDRRIQVEYEFPAGMRLEVNNDLINKAAAEIKRLAGDGVAYTVTTAGASGFTSANTSKGGIYALAPEKYKDRTLSNQQIQDIVRKVLNRVPGLKFNFINLGGTGSSGAAVSLKIASNDRDALSRASDNIQEALRNVSILSEVRTNMDTSMPEVKIVIDRIKAAEQGFSFQGIATEIRNNIEGGKAGTFEYKGNDIDIWTVLRKEDRESLLDLDKVFITNTAGVSVTLGGLAHLEKGQSSPQIYRENQRCQINVSADSVMGANGKRIAPSVANARALEAIEKEVIMPEGVKLTVGGDLKDLQELAPKILIVLLLAVFLVYAVMAAQFENLKDPFIIITSIMTAPIGPSLIYLILSTPMSTYSMIGFIVLAGIVVNHGIVYVDYTNLLRKRGLGLEEAVIQAGRHRLRPIFMTTCTTVLGMIPMAIASGDGTTMSRPIGQTVLAGMISSSVLTLLFTPVVYYVFNKKGEKRKMAALAARKAELEAELAQVRS